MGLYPRPYDPSEFGLPTGPYAHCYFVDPQSGHGDDDNSGLNPKKPLATVIEAEDRCVADHNDTVVMIGGPTAYNPAASIVWDKSYTHLIGLSSNVYGVGQRCRIVMQAVRALTPTITISGNGCIVRNIQFHQEKAAGAASGVAIVTGQRCYFENVFFMCPVATDAASYSLKLSGGENVFKRCTIGQHTLVRSAASRGLWLHKGAGDCHRNKFVDCEFLSWASGGGTAHVLVYTDADIDVEVFTAQFENCLFANVGPATLAVAIDDNCPTTDHALYMRGLNGVSGCTAVADPLTYVMQAELGTGTQSGLLMAAVNES